MLIDDLYAHADARGSQVAIVYGEERLTYAELADRVDRLAHGLTADGIAAGDPVALLLPNSPAFVISFLAVAGHRGDRRSAQPALQARRARLLLPQQRRPGGDRRRSRDRGVGADRGGRGTTACSSSRLDRRAGARARSTGSSRRTPADGTPPVRPPRTSSSSTPPGPRAGRSAWRGHRASAGRRPTATWWPWTSRRPTGCSARSPCSTPTGWGTASRRSCGRAARW